MNFFEHQDQARKNTTRLIVLFLLAVLSLIALTTIFVGLVLYYSGLQSLTASPEGGFAGVLSLELVAGIAVVIVSVVALASVYKLLQLAGGGEKVAESLGGRRLQPNTSDANERKLLNVVEEMAIASGTPVPPVFLLEETGINAFAAGYNANDAVIGVTRGCMELLNREQLQGVIAHEFSHILHGDMRLNIRLIGILHGILVIGLLGSMLVRSSGISNSRNRASTGAVVLALGLGLVIIGYAGTFFGKWIKAAVSRQREYLADASAVQFTRNPAGISQALQKIGGYSYAAEIRHPRAEEFSHMYFGGAILSAVDSLMATHPPLEARIQRIDPQWNGEFPVVDRTTAYRTSDEAVSGFADTSVSQPTPDSDDHTAADMPSPPLSVDSIGAPTSAHLQQARQLLADIPAPLQDAAHDPFAARALIFSLLIEPATADAQWQQLRQRAHPVVYKLARELQATVHQLPREQRLPLFILAVPALKTLSERQHQVFKENIVALIKADRTVNTFEWALYRMLLNALEPKSGHNEGRYSLRQLGVACQQLLSTLATAGHLTENAAEAAYDSAMAQLGLANLPLLGGGQISLPMLDRAIAQLQALKPLQKPQLLKALITCIQHDGMVEPQEYELFRAIADCLDCPVPPLLT